MQNKDDKIIKNKSALFKISAFLRSNMSEKYNLDSVDRALLYAISGYIGMSEEQVCKARYTHLMRESGIKNNTSYGKHLRKLQDLKLIKTVKNWKLNYHYLGDFFNQLDNIDDNKSTTFNVLDKQNENLNDVKRNSSTTLNVSDQRRKTSSTIDIENKEIEIIDNITPIFPFLKKPTEEEGAKKMSKQPQLLQKMQLFKYIPISDNKDYQKTFFEKVLNKFLNTDLIKKIPNKKLPSENFKKFWHEYPRQQGMQPCWKYWTNQNLEAIADDIIADVITRKLNHDPWLQENGKYIVNPIRYLRDEVWHDSIILQTTNQGGNAHEQHNRHPQQPKSTIVNRAQSKLEERLQRYASFNRALRDDQQSMAPQRNEDIPRLAT